MFATSTATTTSAAGLGPAPRSNSVGLLQTEAGTHGTGSARSSIVHRRIPSRVVTVARPPGRPVPAPVQAPESPSVLPAGDHADRAAVAPPARRPPPGPMLSPRRRSLPILDHDGTRRSVGSPARHRQRCSGWAQRCTGRSCGMVRLHIAVSAASRGRRRPHHPGEGPSLMAAWFWAVGGTTTASATRLGLIDPVAVIEQARGASLTRARPPHAPRRRSAAGAVCRRR